MLLNYTIILNSIINLKISFKSGSTTISYCLASLDVSSGETVQSKWYKPNKDIPSNANLFWIFIVSDFHIFVHQTDTTTTNSNVLIFDANTFLPLMSIPLYTGVPPLGITINNGESYLIVTRYVSSSFQLFEIDLDFKVNWMPRHFQFTTVLFCMLNIFQ